MYLLSYRVGSFNNRDAPLSDVSWSLVVMVVLLGFALLLLSSDCILIAINWTGFTKNNPLMFVANALTT